MGKLLEISDAITECRKKRCDDIETVLLDAYYGQQPYKK